MKSIKKISTKTEVMTTVTFDEFNPDLLEIKKPAVNKFGGKSSYVNYKGGNLILDMPKMQSSGIFWQEPGPEMAGKPKPKIAATWNQERNPNLDREAVLRGFDKVFCAIFRKMAPFGAENGFKTMMTLAKSALPEKLDQNNEAMEILTGEKMSNRTALSDIMQNFFYVNKDGNPVSYFELRKGNSTTQMNAGRDPYDCQFKMFTKEKEESIPWSQITGGVEHSFRLLIQSVYFGKRLSIQCKVISSTIYSLSAQSASGFVGSRFDEAERNQLSDSKRSEMEELYRLNMQKAGESSSSPPREEGLREVQVPSMEAREAREVKEVREEAKSDLDALMSSMPSGGEMSEEKRKKLESLLSI